MICFRNSRTYGITIALLGLLVLQASTGHGQPQNLISTVTNGARCPSIELSMPLFSPAVREHLRIEPEHFDVLKKAIYELEEAMPKISLITEEPIENRINLFESYMKKAEEADLRIWGVLTELFPPEDMDNLMGMHIGIQGLDGIRNARIAERLQVTQDQQDKIHQSIEQLRMQKRELAAKLGSGKLTEQEKAIAAPNHQVAYLKVCEALSPSQIADLNKLLEVSKPSPLPLRFGW